MPHPELDRFARDLQTDDALQARFTSVTDADTFVAEAVKAGAERGYRFSEADVQAYMNERQQQSSAADAALSDDDLDQATGGRKLAFYSHKHSSWALFCC